MVKATQRPLEMGDLVTRRRGGLYWIKGDVSYISSDGACLIRWFNTINQTIVGLDWAKETSLRLVPDDDPDREWIRKRS